MKNKNLFSKKTRIILITLLSVGLLSYGAIAIVRGVTIESDMDFGGTYGIKNLKGISIGTTTIETGKILFPDGTVQSSAESGGAWSSNAEGIYYTNGNVGVGVSSPSSTLHVAGTSTFRGNVNLSSGSLQLPIGEPAGQGVSNAIDFTMNASNISSGEFGTNTGGGDYIFPSKLTADRVKLISRTSAPLSPETGEMYYDSSVNKIYIYTGTEWKILRYQ